MTRKECIDGMQRTIDEDRNKILVRIHVGYLIHAVKYLKEQEPVKPIPFFESPNYVVCGHCKSIKAIMPKHTKQKYCHECGTPVLWEGL